MEHDFVWWIFMIATASAFATFIGVLLFLFLNALKKKRGQM